MNYLTLPIGAHTPGVVNAVIEIPGDQANKYEYDKSLHVFRLARRQTHGSSGLAGRRPRPGPRPRVP